MQNSPIVVAVGLLASSVAWAFAVVFGAGPLGDGPAALLAIDLLVAGTVIAVGLVLTRGRWARRAALFLLVCQSAVGIAFEVNGWWIAAVVLSAVTLAGVAGPGPRKWLRKLPPEHGPPAQALALTLGLLFLPGLVAVSAPVAVPAGGWVLTGLGFGATWAYARAWRPALWALRVGLPVAGVAAVATLDWMGILFLGVAVAVLTMLAWAPEVRRAMGTTGVKTAGVFPIPPELAPPEVLHAAGLDERGRPRETGAR